jgi:glycosyltransferase involved in cell wall biosynthesis
MFVANDVSRDSRVLREAQALGEAGHEVTVLGILTAATADRPLEIHEHFKVRRLPYRPRPPRWWVPADFYARVWARARRQYTLHRAPLLRMLRRIRRSGRILRARIRRIPYHVSRARRLHGPRLWRAARRRRGVISRAARRMGTRPADELRRSVPQLAAMPGRAATWARAVRRRGWRWAKQPRLAHRAIQLASVRAPRRAGRATSSALRRMYQAQSGLTGRLPLLLAGAARRAMLLSRRVWRTAVVRVSRPPQRGSGPHAPAPGPFGAALRLGERVVHGVRAWLGLLCLMVWGTLYMTLNWLSRGALDWLWGWRWRWLGWATYAVSQAPDADVWHAHDLTSLPAAHRAKRERGGGAVYDSHEIYLESGRHAAQPRWAKAVLARMERRMASEMDAIITVNDSLSAILARRLAVPAVTAVYNCPLPATSHDQHSRLRQALQLPAPIPLLLYHGSLTSHRGLPELLAALQHPALAGVHLAFMGHGALQPWLIQQAQDSALGDRVHVLDGVPPAELLEWLVGVDVAVAPIQHSTLNHYYSSPNKVFEAIAVGTPVAGSDYPEFRKVIRQGPHGSLGVLFDPSSPADIACRVRDILDMSPEERARLSQRCLRASRERWNWKIERKHLLRIYDDLPVTSAELADASPAVSTLPGAGWH